MGQLLPKIVSSYALDAVVAPEQPGEAPFEPGAVRRWLARLAEVPPRVHASVGLGDALRWNAPTRTAALAVDGRLIHFAGFALDEASDTRGHRSQIRSASWRRARRTV